MKRKRSLPSQWKRSSSFSYCYRRLIKSQSQETSDFGHAGLYAHSMRCSNSAGDQAPASAWLLTNDAEACEPQVLKRTGLADRVQEGVQEERNMSCQKSWSAGNREHTMWTTRETKWAHNLALPRRASDYSIATAPQKWVTLNSLMGRHEANPALGTAQNLTSVLSITCIPASADQELRTPCCFYYLLLPLRPSVLYIHCCISPCRLPMARIVSHNACEKYLSETQTGWALGITRV